MNMDYYHKHAKCGKYLKFHHNKKVKLRSGKKLSKDYYYCDACKDLIACTLCPSYDDYVLRGQIRVKWWVLKEIRERYGVKKK